MSEPVVFLPDLMCDARLFAPQIEALSQERPVTIAPVTHGDRIEEIASGLLVALPSKFAVVGQGMGGAVALEFLRRAPDRLMRMALIGCDALADTPGQAAERDLRIARARAGRLDAVMETVVSADLLAPGRSRMEVLALTQAMARDLGETVYVRQERAMQRRRDQQGALARCRIPVLVMCGALDAPAQLRRAGVMAGLIKTAGLEIVDGAGLRPTLEQPEAVIHALRDWMHQPFVLS
jgi:pimeloyl-ACP methyl ester carboxylesterase